jgi:HlyD family secretion protein
VVIRSALVSALLLCTALPAASAAEPPVAETRPPTVTVVPAERGAIAETEIVTGTLVPREEVLVSPQLDGLAVTAILAEEGDTVQAGQVLARLSRDVLDASLAQNTAQIAHAQAAVAQAQSGLTEAEANRAEADAALARARDLVGSGTTSRETFDQRQAAAQTGAARIAAAEAAQHLAQADLMLAEAQRQELLVRVARTEIRAPVSGVISRRAARLGAVVGSAGEPLFRIIEDGAVELEGDVPEADLVRLRPGEPATLHVAGRGADLPGKVRLVSPEISATTRLGRVRVALDVGEGGGGAGLPIGGFARATVETARHEGVLVPLSAVLFGPDGPRVQVVANGVVETRPVALGLRDEVRAEVVKGLQAGESVIAVSGSFVRGGDRVVPVAAQVASAGQ